MPQHRNFSSSKIEIFYLVNIGIGIGSVSADMKKRISVIYRIGRFKKWLLSVHIGIGRYEKKLIGRTLTYWQMILLRNSKMQGLPVVGKISWYKTCHIIMLYFSKTIDDHAR